ncbi:MAG: zinc ribbon domain-containing protein [Anaerolineales bacterium]
MYGSTRKWLLLALLFAFLAFPFSAGAQGGITLETLTVQLWPEFDQPAMLVIYDFTLPEGTSLPVDVSLRIPTDATLIAVAYAPSGGNLLNLPYQDPYEEDGWQVFTMTADMLAIYHIEYYAPLARTDAQREFLYLWPGDYAVETFNVSVRPPLDTTEITTDPQMGNATTEGSALSLLEWGTSDVEAGEELPIRIAYTKSSDRLGVSDQPLETGNVDENTQGRVSLSNYLPYILGGLGALLILVGGLYFWQTSKGKSLPRKRHRSVNEETSDGDVYCHQCGKRAQGGDRFCRTCGTRLRKEA